MIDLPRLERLLGSPERARLLDRLVARLERDETLDGVLRLSGLSEAERVSLTGLLGRARMIGASVRVDLDDLASRVIESGTAPSLRAAVEALRGPIASRATVARRSAETGEWAARPLRDLTAARPEFSPGVEGLLARGGLLRVGSEPGARREVAEAAARVLAALPARDEGLAVFASRTLGSAHALDVGKPVTAVVLAVLGGGVPTGGGASVRRERWGAHGVLLDELSSQVLALRLPVVGPIGDLSMGGEPVVLTLRQVRTLGVSPVAEVFVCENPAVVEAAAGALGSSSAPLVCLQGQPSAAALLLLRRMSPAVIRYHGDFDWGGIRVANTLFERVGFVPWRFETRDLEASADLPGEPLRPPGADAFWDPDLRASLEARGRRLEEEQVLAALLADLAL